MKKSNVAKDLFKTDLMDGHKRRLTGGFWNTDSDYPFKPHIGVDYGADIGEELIAYDDYEVIGINTGHSDYGQHVFLYFPKIDKTGHYAHLSKVLVSLGQKGSKHDVVGLSGNTGKSAGPHLHFGMANGRVTNTNKGTEGNPWINFETYVYPSLSNASGFNKDDTVYVATGAKSYDGVSVSNIWYSGKHTIDELVGDRAVLDIGTGTTAFNTRDLIHYGETPNASKPSPKPVEDRTGQTLVIYPQWLEGCKDVDLLRRDGSKYPNGINSSDGRERRYKIVEQVSDGFYKVVVPNADTSETYIKWREGIGFEKA